MNPKYQNFTEIIPEIWHVTDIIAIFNFGLFFALLRPPPPPPLETQKVKISKKWKNTWNYHHFTRVSKIMIR